MYGIASILAMNDGILATQDIALLSKLKLQQRDLSDYKFARKLGVTRPLWQATRTERVSINLTLLKAIARTYPDMHPDIIKYLKDGREA